MTSWNATTSSKGATSDQTKSRNATIDATSSNTTTSSDGTTSYQTQPNNTTIDATSSDLTNSTEITFVPSKPSNSTTASAASNSTISSDSTMGGAWWDLWLLCFVIYLKIYVNWFECSLWIKYWHFSR